MPDSIKSLKKSKQKLKSKNQLEAARKDLKRQEERVRTYEGSSANGRTCSLNVEAKKSLEFLGTE